MSNPNRSRANSNNNAAPHGMSASARQNSSSTIQTAPTYNSQQYSAPQTFVAQQGYRTSPPMPRPSNYQQSSPLPMPPPSNYQNDRQYQSQQQLDGSQYSAQSRPSVNRTKTVMRHIPLTKQGNLVIDVPVAERIRSLGKYSHDEEFTHVRYSAATASADDFSKSGFILRQQEYGRQTEMFIVVTMYNEDDYLFCKSMTAIMKNIAYLCTRTNSKTWGQDGWKKVVVCIVSDGRAKINPRTLDVLGLMGCFQEGIMKQHVNSKPVHAHIFEYTTQVCVTSALKVQGHEKGYVPVQILFCLKEKNAKKINSHRWFFNAFGPLLRPNVCILIDVGTKPTPTSLYHLWKAFDKNMSVGGACGEIYAELGPGCSNLLNPLVAAQNFEYKMSNILDKPLESMFGYISVLPGAFSAYRYSALLGVPLDMYFKGETLHGSTDIKAANMYLAEDRVLCFEIVTKKNASWLLKYVKSARAETDVPDGVPEFISQRRRWLNGSFFAGVHALTHWYYIWRSSHNLLRKCILMVEFGYNAINLFFSWFGLAFFYLTFFFLVSGVIKPDTSTALDINTAVCSNLQNCTPAFDALKSLYIASVVVLFICSLGNRPQGSKAVYIGIMLLFAFIMGVMLFFSAVSIFQIIDNTTIGKKSLSQLFFGNRQFRDMILATASTFGLYLLSSILYFDPWHMLTSFLQYLFFLPSFVNILTVYSFCNLHDVSWGTKGDNNAAALGGVTTSVGKDGKEVVEVEFPSDQGEINYNYERFIRHLAQPRPDQSSTRDEKTKQEDYFKNFRTRVVLTWMGSNAIVVAAITNETVLNKLQSIFTISSANASSGINPFLSFIFYSVLGLSLVRFVGSTTYLIKRAFFG